MNAPDLLTKMFASRRMRNLIAVAIFIQVLEVYYGAGKDFFTGFQRGLGHGFAAESATAPKER